jgi:hypothetical protein
MKLNYGKKTGLRYFDIENVRSWQPCYDPIEYLQENKRYTSHADKIWVAMRTDLISEKCMRLFAVWCSRQVLKHDANKSLFKALEAAEKFTKGEITAEELRAAESSAWSAARSAARSAAESAASAAWSAAWGAASAARSAAESAASAARNAAESAAWSAASAARSAEQQKQINKLIEMVKIEGLDRVKGEPR